MSRQLLVPVGGSPLSKRALEHAFEEYNNASVIALHVLGEDLGYSSPTDVGVRNEPPHGPDEWYERANGAEEKIFPRSSSVR